MVAEDVVMLRPDAGSIGLITGKGGELPFDHAVIAGGVWSRELVKTMGRSVPLVAERGYNTTYANSPIDLPVPVFFAEHGLSRRRLPMACGSAARSSWPRPKRRRTSRALPRCGRRCAATFRICPMPAASNGWEAGRRRRIHYP
jgi:glycine/D-amino acid oxidase-like deaminating enzyme